MAGLSLSLFVLQIRLSDQSSCQLTDESPIISAFPVYLYILRSVCRMECAFSFVKSLYGRSESRQPVVLLVEYGVQRT